MSYQKTRILAIWLLLALVGLTGSASAAVINPILNLDINGTFYNVTFHTATNQSFSELWDRDGDGTFGGGGSLFDSAPTFWGDQAGALAAGNAIASFLGTTDASTDQGIGSDSDGFYIPYSFSNGLTNLVAPPIFIDVVLDQDPALANDSVVAEPTFTREDQASSIRPYASFVEVPEPFTLGLLLTGLVGMRRRFGH